jgi:hypothetical protein
MNIEAKKLSLMQRLLNVRDEAILQKLDEILSTAIVAYTADGNPLTQEAYNLELHKAEEDILHGRTYTAEELVKAIKG